MEETRDYIGGQERLGQDASGGLRKEFGSLLWSVLTSSTTRFVVTDGHPRPAASPIGAQAGRAFPKGGRRDVNTNHRWSKRQ